MEYLIPCHIYSLSGLFPHSPGSQAVSLVWQSFPPVRSFKISCNLILQFLKLISVLLYYFYRESSSLLCLKVFFLLSFGIFKDLDLILGSLIHFELIFHPSWEIYTYICFSTWENQVLATRCLRGYLFSTYVFWQCYQDCTSQRTRMSVVRLCLLLWQGSSTHEISIIGLTKQDLEKNTNWY